MKRFLLALTLLMPSLSLMASEADLKMPEGFAQDAQTSILYWGFLVVVLGMLFGFWQFMRVRRLPAHQSMLEMGNVIFKTCSTYLKQQGKFLAILFAFTGPRQILTSSSERLPMTMIFLPKDITA